MTFWGFRWKWNNISNAWWWPHLDSSDNEKDGLSLAAIVEMENQGGTPCPSWLESWAYSDVHDRYHLP